MCVCSTRCSNGTKYRDVKCWKKKKDGSDFFVSDSECNNLDKPDTAIGCNVRPCGTHWKSSDWSICSRRCGLGIQNRSLVCVDVYSQIVNELYCLEDVDRPPSIRPCDEGPCYYSWYTSEWSKVLLLLLLLSCYYIVFIVVIVIFIIVIVVIVLLYCFYHCYFYYCHCYCCYYQKP